jgi:hypothetical protein
MSPRRMLWMLVPLLALSLSGCSSVNTSLQSLLSIAPTPTPTPAPTATVSPPSVSSTGFDTLAANCPDAADEVFALIAYANSQNYNFDMHLQVSPILGCFADAGSAAYRTFIRQVTVANLTMYALDTSWIYGYVSTRDLFLRSVFTKLQSHYPSLTNAQITIEYNGQVRATLTFNGHGAPTINDIYG